MKNRFAYTIRMLVCCAALIISAFSAYAQDAAPVKDIVDTAAAAGSFTALTKALQAAGLTETLKGAGPFTVFAPNDAAFTRLPAGMLDDWLKPENKAQLASILSYHVVPGKLMSGDVFKSKQLDTVNGQRLIISKDADIVAVDNAKIVQTDIVCSNGVIHVIDTPVVPR